MWRTPDIVGSVLWPALPDPLTPFQLLDSEWLARAMMTLNDGVIGFVTHVEVFSRRHNIIQ